MPEFQANFRGGNANRGESPLLMPPPRSDNNGRCSRYTCAPGISDDSKFAY